MSKYRRDRKRDMPEAGCRRRDDPVRMWYSMDISNRMVRSQADSRAVPHSVFRSILPLSMGRSTNGVCDCMQTRNTTSTPYPAVLRVSHRPERTQVLYRAAQSNPLESVAKVWGKRGQLGVQNRARASAASGRSMHVQYELQ